MTLGSKVEEEMEGGKDSTEHATDCEIAETKIIEVKRFKQGWRRLPGRFWSNCESPLEMLTVGMIVRNKIEKMWVKFS